MAALRRVFIANRGEIAQRIVRACQAVGAESVACAPADDAASLHTLSADRAVTLPGAHAHRTFCRAREAASDSRADAVCGGIWRERARVSGPALRALRGRQMRVA